MLKYLVLLGFLLCACQAEKKDNSPTTDNTTQTEDLQKNNAASERKDLPFNLEIENSNNTIVDSAISKIEKEIIEKDNFPPPPQKPKKVAKKMSIITFDSTLYRLAEMDEGEIVNVVFHFWNDGNAPLSITEVDVTCGCTTPSIPFLDITPGDTSQIKIQYNSVGKSGLQKPEIIVKSNGTPTFTTLRLEVFVKEKIEMDSTSIEKSDSLPN